jgi:hypothetical protein
MWEAGELVAVGTIIAVCPYHDQLPYSAPFLSNAPQSSKISED